MIRHTVVSVPALDGTTGGTIGAVLGLSPDYKFNQVSISGRTTGTITVTAKTEGGQATEPFSTPLTISLGTGEFTVFPIGGFTSLTFTPDAPGDDFVVTINQWVS